MLIKEGFLLRQSRVLRLWRRRWFVLIGTRLFYFLDAPRRTGEVGYNHKGFVDISGAAVEMVAGLKRPYVFRITPAAAMPQSAPVSQSASFADMESLGVPHHESGGSTGSSRATSPRVSGDTLAAAHGASAGGSGSSSAASSAAAAASGTSAAAAGGHVVWAPGSSAGGPLSTLGAGRVSGHRRTKSASSPAVSALASLPALPPSTFTAILSAPEEPGSVAAPATAPLPMVGLAGSHDSGSSSSHAPASPPGSPKQHALTFAAHAMQAAHHHGGHGHHHNHHGSAHGAHGAPQHPPQQFLNLQQHPSSAKHHPPPSPAHQLQAQQVYSAQTDSVALVSGAAGSSAPQGGRRRTRALLLCANSAAERDEWVELLREVAAGDVSQAVLASHRNAIEESSSSSWLGVLRVTLVEAADLKVMDPLQRKSDPFVVVSFGPESRRTRVVLRSLNPRWDEVCHLRIHSFATQYTLQLSVYDHDRITENDMIGRVCVSPGELGWFDGVARDLWFDLEPASERRGLDRNIGTDRDKRSSVGSLGALASAPSPMRPLALGRTTSAGSASASASASVPSAAAATAAGAGAAAAAVASAGVLAIPASAGALPHGAGSSTRSLGRLHIRVDFRHRQELESAVWTNMLHYFDVDGSGRLDRAQFSSMIAAVNPTLTGEEIDTLYDTADAEKDGDVGVEELTQILSCSEVNVFANMRQLPITGDVLPESATQADVISYLGHVFERDGERAASALVTETFLVEQFAAQKMRSRARSANVADPLEDPRLVLVMDRVSGQVVDEFIPTVLRVGLRALYQSILGRTAGVTRRAQNMLLKMSRQAGEKYESAASVKEIPRFVSVYNVNTDEIVTPPEGFRNFNEFFFRRLKPGARPIAELEDARVAVCGADSRCVAFPQVSLATRFWIKGRHFNLNLLLGSSDLAQRYAGGSLVIFRLAPQDYHRIHVPVNCRVGRSTPLGEQLYAVNPMAVRAERFDVFIENKRVVTTLHSDEFGDVIYIPVGATLVGSIVQTCREGDALRKGDEYGYFAFGGSTVIVLFEPGRIKLDGDLVMNSMKPLETLVRMGQSLGRVPAAATAD